MRVLHCSVTSDSLQSYGQSPTRLLCPWGFSRQAYWGGLPCPPSSDLPHPGIKTRSPEQLHLSYWGSPAGHISEENHNF